MKKIGYGLLLLALLLLPAHPAYAWSGPMDGRVVIGQNFTLKSGDTLDGDLVVIGGEATIEQDATVIGNVVVIGGNLKMDGTAAGDAVVIGGLVLLGEKASVAGDLVTVGGSLQRAVGAEIGGNIIRNLPLPTIQIPLSSGGQTPPLPPAPRFDFNFGPFAAAASVFFQAIGLAALAMLLTVFLHPQLERVAQAVVKQPFIAGSIGLLTAFLAPVALVILVVTLILIPVAMAAVLLLVLAWLFGVVAFGMEVGERFTKALHQSWAPVLSAGFGTFLLAIVVGTVNLVPCVGWLAPLIVGLMGLGAAVITMFGTRSVYRPALNMADGGTENPPIPPAA
jgi:hypothetical protein